jgi:hypothetical protein
MVILPAGRRPALNNEAELLEIARQVAGSLARLADLYEQRLARTQKDVAEFAGERKKANEDERRHRETERAERRKGETIRFWPLVALNCLIGLAVAGLVINRPGPT